MEFLTILLLAISLAMDALAVSVSNGIAIKNFKKRYALKIGIYFGVFQFMMPLIGYFAGTTFSSCIERFSAYIAFILLSIIGGKMLDESIKDKSCDDKIQSDTAEILLRPKRLIFLAIATSIDALAAGISIIALGYNILFTSIIIGIVAFLFSFVGALLGDRIGILFKKRAEMVGRNNFNWNRIENINRIYN